MILLGWTPGHARQSDEVLRDEGQRPLQKQWAGDELLGAVCKLLNHEISLLQRRKADTDREIETSRSTSTRRLVLSRCTSTFGYLAMKQAIISPT